jgi:hypothetical protein
MLVADHLESERDVFGHVLVRQQPEILKDRADLAAHGRDLPAAQLVELAAGNKDFARAGSLLPQDESQERRLAGS